MHKSTDIETLYIDFDSFFASVEQQLVPRYRNRPMGVLPLDSLYSGFIAVSREAKALGIKRGERLIDVRETYPDFPAAIARHDVYIHMHHRILKSVSRSLPIHKVWSVDEVECRLMSNERENWSRLAADIRGHLINDIGPYITPSIGFGPNQVLAKIAAEMKKPNGLVCLQPQDLPRLLYGIELSDIPGIGRRMKERLKEAKITTVKQLMALSGKQMRQLWRSVEGERLWAGLHGYRTEPVETKRNMFGHGRILSPDWRNRAGVRNCARLLLVKAARRLRRQNYAASQMSVSIGFRDRKRCGLTRQFAVPAFDDQVFLKALEEMLDEVWDGISKDIPVKVSVCLFGLVAQRTRSEDLLETENVRRQRHRWEEISVVMDTLNTRYGDTKLSLGTYVEPPGGYAGGKIAFGRIPNLKDFI